MPAPFMSALFMPAPFLPAPERFSASSCLLLCRHVTPSESKALTLESSSRRDERSLITKMLGGDRIAARELYDAHSDRVFRLAFRLSGDDEMAREVTQETFIRDFGQLARFR